MEDVKNCPKCQETIKKKASKCKHCGEKQGMGFCSIIVLVFFGFFLFSYIVGSFSDSSSSDKHSTPEITDTIAYVMSQGFVEDRLTSPSTADFPLGDFQFTTDANGDYVIQSYVDSQNGFGATIRSYYIATMRYNGGQWADSNNWELISITIN